MMKSPDSVRAAYNEAIKPATTSVAGRVMLSESIYSPDNTKAATPSAVKAVNDKFGVSTNSFFRCAKAGNIVAISAYGSLGFSSSSSVTFPSVIPSGYRPPLDYTQAFYSAGDSYNITAKTNGDIVLTFFSSSGTPVAKTSLPVKPTISYAIA